MFQVHWIQRSIIVEVGKSVGFFLCKAGGIFHRQWPLFVCFVCHWYLEFFQSYFCLSVWRRKQACDLQLFWFILFVLHEIQFHMYFGLSWHICVHGGMWFGRWLWSFRWGSTISYGNQQQQGCKNMTQQAQRRYLEGLCSPDKIRSSSVSDNTLATHRQLTALEQFIEDPALPVSNARPIQRTFKNKLTDGLQVVLEVLVILIFILQHRVSSHMRWLTLNPG